MKILVIAEHNNERLSPNTKSVISAAQKINGEIHLCVLGKNISEVVEQSKSIPLLTKIIYCDDHNLEGFIPESMTPTLLSIASNYTHILAPSSTFGKNFMPRLSAKLDAVQISDVIKIEDSNTFVRPIYAGNAISYVQTDQEINLLTIRPTAFEKCEDVGGEVNIEILKYVDTQIVTKFISREVSKSDRPELGSARVVISGGRALENSENFKLIYDLAEKLNAAVGASRAAVDAGFIGNEYQVGQTGKMVAPELYIAVGISGAIQHLAGMKDSKIIVAINKDNEAPIFSIADYGLQKDLFEAIPELINELSLLNQIDS